MKIPKTANIYGRKWKFSVEKLPEGVAGLCDKNMGHIYISEGMTDKEFEQTLIHEMGHALITRLGLDQVLSLEVEEIIVDSFATFFLENVFPLKIDKGVHQEPGNKTAKE